MGTGSLSVLFTVENSVLPMEEAGIHYACAEHIGRERETQILRETFRDRQTEERAGHKDSWKEQTITNSNNSLHLMMALCIGTRVGNLIIN